MADNINEALKNLEDLLNYMEIETNLTNAARDQEIEAHVVSIYTEAIANGMTENQLHKITNILRQHFHFLKIKHQRTLALSLIPAGVVPTTAFGNILCLVGKIASSPIRLLLFKWLTATLHFNIIADKSELLRYYEFFLTFLQSDRALMPYAAHILYLLTKSYHVTEFRTNVLQALLKSKLVLQKNINENSQKPKMIQITNEIKILRTLLELYQLYIPLSIVTKKDPKFKPYFKPLGKFQNSFNAVRLNQNPPKRLLFPSPFRYSPLPNVIRSEADIHEAQTVLHSIADIAVVMRSPLRTIFLDLVPEKEFHNLYLFWSLTKTREELSAANPPEISYLRAIAEVANHFTDQKFKQDKVLMELLPYWDGIQESEAVFSLIETISCQNFLTDGMKALFGNLHTLYVSGEASFQGNLIESLTRLLSNWMIQELPESKQDLRPVALKLKTYICELITHGLFLNRNESAIVLDAGFHFYNTIFDLVKSGEFFLMTVPENAFVQAALVSFVPVFLSGLGLLLVKGSKLVTMIKDEGLIEPDTVDRFNAHIANVGHHLWQGNALKIFSKDMKVKILEKFPDCADVFSIYRHPALSFAREEISKLEKGPLVDWLTKNPTTKGIGVFLRTFVKDLNK